MNSGRYYHHQSSGNGGGRRRAEDDDGGGGGGGRHFSGRGRGRGRSAEAAARGAPPHGGGGGRAGRRRPDIGPGRPRRPLVLLLVGIPGSGKSHFASRLEAGSSSNHRRHGGSPSSPPHGTGRRTTARLFVRVNQDALGSRRRCEDVARSALAGGGGNNDASSVAVVIDRCNFDADQRRTWIDMAHEMEADVECVIFDFDRDVCIERCRRRRGHETIRPSEAAMIVSRMAGSFRPPVPLPPPPSRDYDDEEDGSAVRCRGGERFRRLSRVSSFRTSDDLVEYYLGR